MTDKNNKPELPNSEEVFTSLLLGKSSVANAITGRDLDTNTTKGIPVKVPAVIKQPKKSFSISESDKDLSLPELIMTRLSLLSPPTADYNFNLTATDKVAITIPYGCYVIAGPSASGKTYLARWIASSYAGTYVGISEPDEPLVAVNDVSMINYIYEAASSSQVIVVNSLKNMKYVPNARAGEGLAEGGVRTFFLLGLTVFAQMCVDKRRYLFVVVPVEDVKTVFVERLRQAASGIVIPSSNGTSAWAVRGINKRLHLISILLVSS